MNKTIVIAGLIATLAAGVAVAQTAPAPGAPAPRPGASAEGPGTRFDGPRGQRGWGRGMRQRPTQEELQKRNAETFARIDANRDGRATFEEFRADIERRRLERQRQMFQRFSGGQDSVTLDQLNARTAQRFTERGPDARRGR